MTRNPARSRPLSRNVRRLMRMARESPGNPNVEKVDRRFNEQELAYCDMQGRIFMAAVDKGLDMSDFSPIYMNSQLAGVIDYGFSRAGALEEDMLSSYLQLPVLMKSPALIVDVVMWLDKIVEGLGPGENAGLAVMRALDDAANPERIDESSVETVDDLADAYEYAYWLGYIYRYECHLHDESSRMVYGAFDEKFMRDLYRRLEMDDNVELVECAPEICRRMDELLRKKGA